ncbi:MAG: hypothetical protein WDO72_20145 [Pseudomonadota bacterium]
MNIRKAWILVTFLGAMGALAAQAATPKCAPGASCIETRSFLATVTSLRTSKQGTNRVVTATVHFENKTAKPLTLGYVSESGLALDELGNRYLVPGPGAVRAIGEISGTNFDPKFTLPPGEGSDAKFELTWDAGKNKAGVSFELDLAIRELTATGADQFKLGQEHAVHFASLGQKAAVTGAVAATATPPPASTDPCGGSPRCFNAGTFIAEVVQVTPTAMAKGVRHHYVSLNIRFRNISDKPLILGYQASSSAAVDNFGNSFTWGRPGTYDGSVKGIGIVSARSADTQFSLAPNQARSATFGVIRYEAKPPIGESWNYNVVIAEIEIQPGQVVKSVRQNSVSFERLAPGSFSGASVAGGGTAAGNATAAALNEAGVPTDADAAVGKMIDLINKKTKKK